MREKKIIQTQIRLPEKIYSEIRQEAEELGVSINAHMAELLWIGIKARKGFSIQQNQEE